MWKNIVHPDTSLMII